MLLWSILFETNRGERRGGASTFRRYLSSIKNKFDGNNNVDHNQALNSAFDQC